MNPEEFAARHFPNHKTSGEEILPVLCPYCRGGKSGDKYTFAMNINTGAYNCKRGSCGVSGSFAKLCSDFGETPKNYELAPPPCKVFLPPKTKITVAQKRVEEYLKKRGFSKETWERRGVGESSGNIALPYFENGKLVLMKFRKPEKYDGQGQKAWRERGGKAVFWGMDQCDPKSPLVVCEGEFDALALDEAGVENVVSVPSGADDLTCVENCWDWLQQFRQVIIWPDGDEPGQKMCREMVNKLGAWRCWIVKNKRKDANEVLFFDGKEAVKKAVITAQEVPLAGLVRLADVKAFDVESMVRVPSSISTINTVVGGYAMGFLSVWTGESGSGKSTLLGQELLTAISRGFNVCAYSGELPAALFRYWIDCQAAGPDPACWEAVFDSIKGREILKLRRETVGNIRQWYSDKFFVYDSFGAVSDENLLEVFEYAYRRYNCRVFLADNLMTMILTGNDRDFYRKQGQTVGRLKDFAHTFGVHVHLVAHPRKAQGRLTKLDVSGSAEITNRPDNVFGLYRCKPKAQENSGVGKEYGCDAILDIFKNRWSGKQDEDVALQFCETSKRFYMESSKEKANFSFGINFSNADIWNEAEALRLFQGAFKATSQPSHHLLDDLERAYDAGDMSGLRAAVTAIENELIKRRG